MINLFSYFFFYHDVFYSYNYTFKNRKNTRSVKSFFLRWSFVFTVYSAFTYMNLYYKYPATLWTCVFLCLDIWYFITGTEDLLYEISSNTFLFLKKVRATWRVFYNLLLFKLINPSTFDYNDLEDWVECFYFLIAGYFYIYVTLFFLHFYEILFNFSDYIIQDDNVYNNLRVGSVAFSMLFLCYNLLCLDFFYILLFNTSWQWFNDKF